MDREQLWRAATNTRYPTEQLRALRALRRELDQLQIRAMNQLREDGMPWEDIAAILGTTRQSMRRFLARSGPATAPGMDPDNEDGPGGR